MKGSTSLTPKGSSSWEVIPVPVQARELGPHFQAADSLIRNHWRGRRRLLKSQALLALAPIDKAALGALGPLQEEESQILALGKKHTTYGGRGVRTGGKEPRGYG